MIPYLSIKDYSHDKLLSQGYEGMKNIQENIMQKILTCIGAGILGGGICKKNLLSGVRRVYALHAKRSISKIVPPPPLKNPLYTPVNIFVKININEP